MTSNHTLAAYAGLVGLTSSTVFFTMNTTINYLTMPTLFLGPRAAAAHHDKDDDKTNPAEFYARPENSPDHLNRQWQQVYRRGHKVGPASALVSGLAYASAAWLSSRTATSSPLARTSSSSAYAPSPLSPFLLFAAAAAAALAVVPYTLIAMVPTNDELHRRADAYTAGRGEAGAPPHSQGEKKPLGAAAARARAAGSVDLVRGWTACSKVRAAISLVGLVLGAAGFMALI